MKSLNINTMLLPKYKWAYIISGKTGSSTIKYLIAKIRGKDISPNSDIHKITREFSTSIIPKDYKKFMIVRNSYTRVASFYVDKILLNSDTSFKKDNKSGVLYNYGITKEKLTKGISFEKFVFEFLPIGIKNRDAHEFIQSKIAEEVKVNYFIKFENFETELKIFLKSIGCNLEIPHLRELKHKPYKEYYTKKIKNKVYELFKKDFEKFNYSKEL